MSMYMVYNMSRVCGINGNLHIHPANLVDDPINTNKRHSMRNFDQVKFSMTQNKLRVI